MAQQLRTTLKGYFQTGNIPVEQHYIDFIDSTLSLTENNSGNIDLTGNITASGNISSSGTTGHHTLGGTILELKGNVSASNDISASGIITGKDGEFFGNITASGNIKCGELDLGGEFSAVNSNLTYLSGSKITLDGPIVSTTLNTGQGDNELYDMDQNVTTTSAVTFATVNTGQGANELFDMDQNVTQASTVTFAGITITKPTLSVGDYGGTVSTSGQSFVIQLNNIPFIAGKASNKPSKSAPTTFTNSSVLISSVILCNCQGFELSVTPFKISAGGFLLSLGNDSTADFTEGSAVFNFTIF